jgi:hypothetical protein
VCVQTKYLRARMNLCKEEAGQERWIKMYTSKMLANGHTKLLEGKEFITFVNSLP